MKSTLYTYIQTPQRRTLFNARSVRNKYDMLSHYKSNSHFDQIDVTETWISDDDIGISLLLTPNKFTLIQYNISKKVGRIPMFYNSNIVVLNKYIDSLTSCQVISCLIYLPQCHFILILMYRLPHSNILPLLLNVVK